MSDQIATWSDKVQANRYKIQFIFVVYIIQSGVTAFTQLKIVNLRRYNLQANTKKYLY